ncbi:PepSY domain-containing protein [Angustibacter speluncae]
MSTSVVPASSDARDQPTPRPPTRTPRGQGLFRTFWRWHFYGAVVVLPVLLVLAVTGLIYLFRFQLEPALHADLMRVDPGTAVASYEAQRLAVAQAHPDDTIVSMTEPAAADHSTRFTLTTADERTLDVFVDPWTGTVLGSLDPDGTLSGTAVRLHADLMSGTPGDLVMELGASWAVVMALTGYYLFVRGWRARRRQRRSGARWARLRSGHAASGAVVGAFLLLLVVSGLPWTGVFGAAAQRLATEGGSSLWSQDHGALSDPTSTLDESLPHSHHTVPWAQQDAPVPSSPAAGQDVSVADVDTAVAVADREGLRHPLTVAMPADDAGVFSVIGYAFDDPGQERTVHVDRFGGQVVSTYGYEQYSGLAKVVSQGIALHEGRRFGGLNTTLTALGCVLVIVSCVTGPLMWWRRRPRGREQLGAPRARAGSVVATPLLGVLVVVLAVVLPVFGASLVLVVLLDRFVLRRVPRLRQFFGSAAPRGRAA